MVNPSDKDSNCCAVIDIYILDIREINGECDSMISVIAPHYVQKYKNAKESDEKMRELGAGFLLSKYLGITSDEDLSFNEYGKPFLNKNGDSRCFSLSHSEKYVVLAVSDREIGADIECSDNLTLNILKRVLPPERFKKLEREDYTDEFLLQNNRHEPCSERKLVWAKNWTAVEAVLKADGRGFFLDIENDDSFMDGWHIDSIVIDEKYVLSCACHAENTVIHNVLRAV